MAEFKELGNEAYQAGEYDKAVILYTSGIEQEPNNAALFSNRSAAFLKVEDYSKAKLDADMCIQLDPKWSKVSFRFLAFCTLARTSPFFRGCAHPHSSRSCLPDMPRVTFLPFMTLG